MDGKALAKRKPQNLFGNMRPIFVSILLALIVTGCASLLGARIMVSQKLPLYTAVPLGSFCVALGVFAGALFQGLTLRKASIACSILTATLLALSCVLAGLPSWSQPHLTAVGIVRTVVLFLAAVLGNQLGSYLRCSKRKGKHPSRR